jgi:hypothetical protein
MRNLIAFALICGLYSQSTFGQAFFSVQWEVTEPTESFREAAGTGFGAKATYAYFTTSRFALTGSVGYVKWGPRVNFPLNNEYKFIVIPIHIGMELLLSKGIVAPYVGVSMGMDYVRIRGIAPNTTIYSDSNELKFGLSPHVGVGLHVAGPVGINLTGAYNVTYTSDRPSKYFGLNAGLAFGF